MKTTFLALFLILQTTVWAQESIVLSGDLELHPINDHTFVHVSYQHFKGFGRVASNGLIYIQNGKALVVDTPVTVEQSELLLSWLREKGVEVQAVIPTHFHEDCLGGLAAFHRQNISSWSSEKTIELARLDSADIPQHAFYDSLELSLEGAPIQLRFFGEGHTRDNFTVWIPTERLLFGGCLIKTMGAGKGNLADANPEAWPETVQHVKTAYPEVQIVIPGHGKYGGPDLLDYTIQMFR